MPFQAIPSTSTFQGGNPNFVVHILSSLVNVRLHTKNWLCNLPGSALKVPVVVVVVVESEHSDQLWLTFSPALVKPNNRFSKSPLPYLTSLLNEAEVK